MKLFLMAILFFVSLNGATIDKQNSSVTFEVKKYANTVTVKGKFDSFDGNIALKNGNLDSFDGIAYISSVKTNDTKRDKELKKDEWFYAEKFPKIGLETIKLDGEKATLLVTIKGISKEVIWELKKVTDGAKVKFVLSGELDRLEFGVGKSSLLISNKINIKVTLGTMRE